MTVPDSIDSRYRDALGHWHHVSAETIRRIRASLRVPSLPYEPVRVVRTGQRIQFAEAADLVLEGGSRESLRPVRARAGTRKPVSLPPDVPPGYHTVEFHRSGRRLALIVAPAQCFLPPPRRTWALAVQLYAARSARSWGIGDLADLSAIARWAGREGAGSILLNPLHAAAPGVPQQASPYSPSTRRFLNPLYVAIDRVPGAGQLPNLQALQAAGRRLNELPLIERDRIVRLKMRALEAIYRRFEHDGRFDAYVAHRGAPLREYGVYCALAEDFGSRWRGWPIRYRDPRSSDVRRYAAARHHRVGFHVWVQWVLDQQLRDAAANVPIMQDLPIGIDPEGADAWAWQDVLAQGVSVGAPPDEFNTKGQNWGLPPFIPERLRQAAYRPFIETIRGTLRHAGGLRIDHVMGLYRLFWIPDGMEPSDGAYVRNAAEDLLGIIALESHRAQAVIAGEDLGTVEEKARAELMAAGLLSYRLLWFEKGDPATYPTQALAAVTTHDLPTVAGLWTGADLRAQRSLGLNPNEAGTQEIRQRVQTLTGSRPDTPPDEVITRTYRALARAPSAIVATTLEDLAVAETRPNMPGAADEEWPNWSRPLPQRIARVLAGKVAARVAGAMRRGRARPRRKPPRR
jgi:4-alpha-glucanotransferase